MARAKTKSVGGGHNWLQATNQVAIGLSLPREEARAFAVLAAQCGASAAQLGRELCRLALAEGAERISKKISKSG